MQARLDIHLYEHEDRFLVLATSHNAQYQLIDELPHESLPVSASDQELGEAVLRAAERCRGLVTDTPSQMDQTAVALGFKSHADLYKRVTYVGVSRRNGAATLNVMPTRKEKKAFVFTGAVLQPAIDDAAAVGKAVKEAAAQSRA